MAKYVLIYRGGSMPETQEQRDAVMAAWTQWFQGLGPAVVDIGNPFGASSTLGGGSGGGATGYSILEASDLQGAVGMAEGCPILTDNGSVDVHEAIVM